MLQAMSKYLIRKLEPRTAYYSHVVWSNVLDREIGVTSDGDELKPESLDYAQDCADAFNSLPKALESELLAASKRYCDDFLESVGEPSLSLLTDEHIRAAILAPTSLHVPMGAELDTVVYIESECQWEDEHGIEILIRDGALLYVGGYCGVDPFGEFTSDEAWNYAVKSH